MLIVGLTFFPLQVQAVPGQGTLFGTNPGQLITIDPATGVGTVVGLPGVIIGFPGLAIDPATGFSFAGCGMGCDEIWNFNLGNGMATFLGSMNGGVVASGLDFRDDGVLFASLILSDASGGSHLGVINTITGEATVIGPFGTCNGSCTIAGIEAIAFDAEGNLWGSLRAGSGAGTPGLYLINPNTGAATFVTSLETTGGSTMPRQAPVSLQFACDGTLYGGTARSNQNASDGGFLVTINPDTGIFSFVGGVSAVSDGEALGGLAFEVDCVSNVPTLSQWGLFLVFGAIGLISIFVLLRRKSPKHSAS